MPVLPTPAPSSAMCLGTLQVTNVESNSLTITGATITLLQPTIANSYQYNFINVCSFFPQGCIGPSGYGPLCAYYAGFTFPSVVGQPEHGNVGRIAGAGNCASTITLNPGDEVDLGTYIDAPSNPSIGTVQLGLTVVRNGVSETAEFPSSLNLTLVYASQSQGACYSLQGSQFVPAVRPSDPAQVLDCY